MDGDNELKSVWLEWPVGTDIRDFEVNFEFNDTRWIEVTRKGHPSDIEGLSGKIEVFFKAPD